VRSLKALNTSMKKTLVPLHAVSYAQPSIVASQSTTDIKPLQAINLHGVKQEVRTHRRNATSLDQQRMDSDHGSTSKHHH
jgi:hypothetical protein